MKCYKIIIAICMLYISISIPSYSHANAPDVTLYLGGKFMIGCATLSVGKYTDSNNPLGPAKDGKTSQRATQIRWGGGTSIGVKIPIIPCIGIGIRAELEYIHGRSAKTFSQGGETKLGFNTNNILLNSYVDFTSYLHKYIRPYIGIGLGVGINELKYTPASIDIGTSTANPVNVIFQTGIGAYFILGKVALDVNIRYLYNGPISKTYINSSGDATRKFKASPHMVEGLMSILIFI